MSDTNPITDALLDARRLLSKSQSTFGNLRNQELIVLHESLEEIVDRLGGLIPGATPPGRIEDFFSQVGEGMLASQAELDRQSFAYNVSRPPGALPTSYRIPKVEAEIGFTLSRKRERGFSFLALGNQATKEKANTNSVRFEIIAAPPVPDGGEELPLAAGLVTRPGDRNEIQNLLRSASLTGQNAATTVSALMTSFDLVLVLAHGDHWLLCLPQGGEMNTLLYGVLSQAPLQFTTYGPVPPSQAKQQRITQLFDFMKAVSSEQALALATLNGPSISVAD